MKTIFNKIKLRSLLSGLAIATLVAIPIFYNNCGNVMFTKLYGATSVGNPMNPTQASEEILFAICSVLDRCQDQVPFNVCMSGVPTVSGIGSRLGLPPNVDDPFSALENAESQGSITANPTATNTCVDTINNLQCSNPNVQNAYNASSSSPFAAVSLMVPISACGQVFTPPVQSYACSTKVFLRGVPNNSNGPAVSGANLTYSVNPALPAGLTMDPNTGIISGTPTAVSPMTAYTVTASGPNGNSSSVLNIRTADGYLVNDLSDAHNVGPGCVSTTGKCTLRAAVEEINSAPSPSVILLPPGSNVLGLGQISITQPMDIYGDCAQGTTVDGNNATQIFSVTSGPTSLNSMTVQNGSVFNSPGAGILISAGASSFTATLNKMIVQNNTITGGASGLNYGAGIEVVGAGAVAQANLVLNNCTISGNINNSTGGQFGGGVNFFNFSQGTISNCTISGNQSKDGGGGASVSGGTVSISNSLFSNNSTIPGGAQEGGGLYLNNGSGANVTVTNVTFASNTGSLGGAIYSGAGNSLNIVNSTFANNVSTSVNYGGAIGGIGSGSTIVNTLFYNNTSSGFLKECAGTGGFNVITSGHNLSDDVAADCNLNVGSGDIVSTSAQLDVLQNNGGPSQTMALLPGSPGVRQANPLTCPATDQRGYPRHIPTFCDIGSFEIQP